jgi:hypothetical protein
VCLLGIVVRSALITFIASHFFPGVAISFILVRNIYGEISFSRRLIFVCTAIVLYAGSVIYMDLSDGGLTRGPVIFIVLSSVGSLLMTAAYELIIIQQIRLSSGLLISWLPGFIAAIPATLCLRFYHKIEMTQNLHGIYFWAGIFSIFPGWFVLLALFIKARYKMPASGLQQAI